MRDRALGPEGATLEPPRYSAVAVVLHWTVAAFIIANLVIGSFMESLPLAPRLTSVRLHISLGVTILALAGIRLLWRLTHRPPPFDVGLSRLERGLAHSVHAGLYLMMVVQPLLGLALISANKSSLAAHPKAFGMIPLALPAPITHLPQPLKEQVHERLVQAHTVGACVLVGLLALHVAGVAKHQLLDKQPQLRRMTLGRWLVRGTNGGVK